MTTTGTPNHFLSIDDFSYAELRGMLNQATALKARLKEIPERPGVYLHKNAEGEVIYVGKARNLRS